ncbi:hypothetical protein GP486_006925 [Trichoglossum hirsutum]|uniref:PPM-type phosphatase domain-containing protein n=1 Tax=Trichoglossum hirsutum TaxID=265104 RepID=A0A9P8ICV1_9PEZI|nr:hypothetical protein GP486_006925 [Trichoglossum hirsutum]
MQRVAAHALRTARRTPVRRLIANRASLPAPGHVLGLRALSSSRRENGGSPTSKSPMYLRNFSIALVSTLVATGAWYAYRDSAPSSAGGLASQRNTLGSTQQTRGLTSQSIYPSNPIPPPSGVGGEEQAAASARRAVVVDNDQVYTGTIAGDGPLQKETDDPGQKVLEMLTPEQATQRLRRNEESYLVGRGNGVVRYDVVQIPSNHPIEDDHVEKIVEVPQSVTSADGRASSTDWMFWGVFDGHSGWTTSAKLRQVLVGFVARELNATYKNALANPSLKFPSPESIDAAIKRGFNLLDNEIVHESVEKVMKANSKRVAAELLAPALSGSCALLSFYDSKSKLLRVACTGDSRAVLGRRSPSGKWIATPLSVDQTGANQDEAERLRREHPGEENVVRNGRILGGLEPSRAFGDAFYKWTFETQERIKRSFFGRTPSQLLRTPPYVTAEPIITTTKVEPEKGDFVVMATDGLWEMLTNEEVVGLVGQWLQEQAESQSGGNRGSSWLKSWFSTQKGLPVEKLAENKNDGGDTNGQRTPLRQLQWGVTSRENERFVTEDKNAATHLVRNALGGRDRDMLCALLTLPSPYSRRYRDDLTVEVIFFGEGYKSGGVMLNEEASAPHGDTKAKL